MLLKKEKKKLLHVFFIMFQKILIILKVLKRFEIQLIASILTITIDGAMNFVWMLITNHNFEWIWVSACRINSCYWQNYYKLHSINQQRKPLWHWAEWGRTENSFTKHSFAFHSLHSYTSVSVSTSFPECST